MNKKIVVFLLVLALVISPLVFYGKAFAEDGDVSWRNPASITGGVVTSIDVNNGTAYVATDAAIFKSTNYEKWEKLPFTFSEGANTILISRYFEKNGIFLGTKDGVFLSRDNGNHWQFFNMGLESSYVIGLAEDENGNFYALSFDGLLMKWKKSEELWTTIARFTKPTATAIYATNGKVYVGCEEGTVYSVSSDGKNKTIIAENLTESPVSKILISPSNMLCIATFYDGVFIGNKGNFDHELKGYKINDEVIDNGSLIVATVGNGVLTNNNGRGWSKIASKEGVIPSAISVCKDGTILVGTLGNGVFTIKNGSMVKSSYGITSANVLTINFSTNYDSDGTVFVGTKWNGLYVSSDKGKTFSEVASFPEDVKVTSVYGNSENYFVGTGGEGLFKTTDGGATFTQVEFNSDYINVIYGTGNTIYVGTGDMGMFVSTDGGATFTQANNGIFKFDTDITAISGVKNAVFIGTNGGNVYETTNGGKTWMQIGAKQIPKYTIADISVSRNFDTDQTLVVGTMGAGLFLSTDGGNTFNNISDALLKYHMWDDGVALSPNFDNDHIILAGSWDGVYLSFDSGDMWTNINGNKDNRYVYKTVFSPDFAYKKSGAIYVATESGGLYIYDQKGKTVVKMVIDQKGMLVNGKFVPTDVPPIIRNNRTLVPIRFVTEAVGADVEWDPTTRKVTITLNGNKVELYIGKNTAYVNGIPRKIDPNNPKVVPVIIHNRTYVPIRFIMEAFGATVEWDPKTRTVTIIYGG